MYFVINKSSNGQYFWRLVGDNHETLCHSETYYTKYSCQQTIQSIKNEGINSSTMVFDTTS